MRPAPLGDPSGRPVTKEAGMKRPGILIVALGLFGAGTLLARRRAKGVGG
jgi:hypothetical protein